MENKDDKKEYDFIEKIILIGISAVDKSNILSRFFRNKFLEIIMKWLELI